MKIYTGTGDKGTTSHLETGRVSKGAVEIEVSGQFDNAIAMIGFAREALFRKQRMNQEHEAAWAPLVRALTHAQQRLFTAAACLYDATATQNPLGEKDIIDLENSIDTFSTHLPDLDDFIVPGGSEANVRLNLARCSVREAERVSVRALEEFHRHGKDLNITCIAYLNRLSDALFVYSRYALLIDNKVPLIWTPWIADEDE